MSQCSTGSRDRKKSDKTSDTCKVAYSLSSSFFLSFDQHSLLDLPAMVDLVLNVSQQEQIYYVGHSQGTVMGFAGFSSMPELASKIKLFVALAPVTTVTYIQGLFKFLTDFYKELEVRSSRSRAILQSAVPYPYISHYFIFAKSPYSKIFAGFKFYGFHMSRQNGSNIPVCFQH